MVEKDLVAGFKGTTTRKRVTVVKDPHVVFTTRGYMAAMHVEYQGETQRIYLGVVSLATPIRTLELQHGGSLLGVQLLLWKVSDEDRYAMWGVEEYVEVDPTVTIDDVAPGVLGNGDSDGEEEEPESEGGLLE